MSEQETYDAIVIGAGQAGLATGFHLQRVGLRFTILEAGDSAGGSWKHYYRSLRLFSPARHSALPGLPFPGDPGHYPSRDATIDYLERYASEHQLPVTTDCRVNEVKRRPDGLFEVQTTRGVFLARALIAASGSFQRPRLPSLPGQNEFRGRLLHSLAYESPEAFAGQRVVVVGAANSGVQIATELAQVAKVSIAARRPPSFIRQRILGADVHAWWSAFGLDSAEIGTWRAGLFKRLHSATGPSVLDAGVYQTAVAAGRPDVRPMFHTFSPDGMVWEDGQAEPVDTVIFATGFLPSLEYLRALGALDPSGMPLQRGGISRTVPGLYHVGLSYQRTYASATLRGVGPDAEIVVKHLQHHLAQPRAHPHAKPTSPATLARTGAIDGKTKEA